MSGPPASRRAWRALILLALAAPFILFIAVALSKRTTEARLFLEDVAAGDGPSALKRRTGPPNRQLLRWTIDGRPGLGDLYLPADEAPLARLVLLPGLVPDGRSNPQLVSFAGSLARTRFAVLVPEIASFRSLALSPADIRAIADAARALSERGTPAPVGFAGVSYALGPALIAALEDDVRNRVAFVLGIGGYYDIKAAITFATTGCFRRDPGEAWTCRAPNDYGKWALARINAHRLESAPDRSTLEAIAGRKLQDPQAEIGDLLATLGPEGRAVMDLLLNADPARAEALLARLPGPVRADLEALSPARYPLSSLSATALLIHGRDDAMIPPTESEKLAAALPDAHLTLVSAILHVEFGGPQSLWDGLALLRAARRLIALRDRMAGAAP